MITSENVFKAENAMFAVYVAIIVILTVWGLWLLFNPSKHSNLLFWGGYLMFLSPVIKHYGLKILSVIRDFLF